MIDLTPLLDIGLEILAAVVMVLASWAIGKFMKKLGIEKDEAIRHYLDGALRAAIEYGKNQVKDKNITIETENEAVAHAANYVVAQVPDALKHFKIDPAGLERLIRSRLGNEAIVPAPGDGSSGQN